MSDFYSVTEFAKKYNKNPGNIRRMLISGTIKGEKIGKQWIIPKETVYPEDSRIKSGKYHNWRKRSIVNQKVPKLLNSLEKFGTQLFSVYGDFLDKVILYGSYARGEQTPDSDIDVAVLLKDGITEEMHDEMIELVVDLELDLGITVSVVPVEYDNYLKWKRLLPFYKNIDREGIVIWKAV
ncbi:MAG: nucleotidyltransferase domain-containing protein [Lachnospiraceae bacterium]|nr:nucleotidyltransferase domain-containing protein [Lachnospiraceae bacterium]